MAITLEWRITQRRGIDTSYKAVQAAEFNLYDENGNKIPWPTGTIVTSSLGTWTGEEADKLIDSNSATKWGAPNWGNAIDGLAIITFLVPEDIRPAAYSYTTAKDDYTRDPVTWGVYYTEDGGTRKLISQVAAATITSTRQTETQRWACDYAIPEKRGGRFYYNGILMPEIPAEILWENPYCWIRHQTVINTYQLMVSSQPWYYSSNNIYATSGKLLLYSINVADAATAEWTYSDEFTNGMPVNSDIPCIWSNHDIPNGSVTATTMYYAASEPLPEGYSLRLVESLEAETGVLAGSAIVDDRTSVSGNIVIDMITSSGGSCTMDFNVQESGYYVMQMYTTSDAREFSYTLDGKKYLQKVVGSGFYSIDMTEFQIYLKAGTNTVRFAGGSTYYAPMLDRFDIFSVETFSRKYLIRSASTLYTITDGTLTALTETEVTASLFRTYGFDELPDAVLLGMTDPEILYWHDSTDDLPTLTASVTGTPPVPQVVITDAQDMSDPTILGIESVTVEASEDVLWAISFDDGATWKAYDGTQWAVLEQENSGMTAETLQAISVESWAAVVTGDHYRIRFVLMDTASYVASLTIHYLNEEVS